MVNPVRQASLDWLQSKYYLDVIVPATVFIFVS